MSDQHAPLRTYLLIFNSATHMAKLEFYLSFHQVFPSGLDINTIMMYEPEKAGSSDDDNRPITFYQYKLQIEK